MARDATANRVTAIAPSDLLAFELTLRARKSYYSFSKESTLEGTRLAERAIAADARFAPAWEILSRVTMQHYLQPYGLGQASPEVLARARHAAQRAIELDPLFSTAHASLGYVHLWEGDHQASLDALRKAAELNPNDASAIAISADVLSFSGFQQESIEAWERAERLDPLQPPISAALRGRSYLMLGQPDRALALARSCAERAPRLQPCFLMLAMASHQKGMDESAREAVRRILEINPGFTIAKHMRLVHFRTEEDAMHFAEMMRQAGLPE